MIKKSIIDCSKMKENDKWPFYDHFPPFFGNYMTIFHKTEVQPVIGHFEVLNKSKPWLIQKIWLKMQIFPFLIFRDIVEKNAFVFFAFCVVTVVPIMIQTCSASQNDRLNLSFVKEFHIVGTKMPRNGHLSDANFDDQSLI